jgi:glycosyltransferase involved in cell wall biosynthesis
VTRALDFFPDWRRGNPFQTMLFDGLGTVDAVARPVSDLVGYLAAARSAPAPGVLNLHWTTPVLVSAGTESEARALVDEFEVRLQGFRDAGGRLVWTVHNVLPHDARYIDSEIRLAGLLATHADLVHVMSEVTAAAASPYYRLDPDRTVCIPHSSYLGVYPDWLSREGARRRLGVLPSEKVLVALGQIRPYKGLDRLLDFVEDAVHDDPTLRLLVAGPVGRHPQAEALSARLASMPRTISRRRRVRDDHLQVWLRAADLAVLPYTGILNSGSFLLAETFGLPVVATRAGALASRDGEAHVRLFDEGRFEETLRSAIRDLVEDPEGARHAHASAEAAAAARPPSRMAAGFADAVGPLLVAAGAEFTPPLRG